MAYEVINNKLTGSTTDATPLTILTIPLASGQASRLIVDVLAKSGNNILTGRKRSTIKNVAGTLTSIALQDLAATQTDVGLATASFTVTTSGTNVIIQVTGIAATTITWYITYNLEIQ